jgi:hypothetical protein
MKGYTIAHVERGNTLQSMCSSERNRIDYMTPEPKILFALLPEPSHSMEEMDGSPRT